jgi:hypothetical protein
LLNFPSVNFIVLVRVSYRIRILENLGQDPDPGNDRDPYGSGSAQCFKSHGIVGDGGKALSPVEYEIFKDEKNTLEVHLPM